MNSILQKYTLYDIFGLLIPGGIGLLILIYYNQQLLETKYFLLILCNNFLCALVFIFMAYIIGNIISQIFNLCHTFMNWFLMKIFPIRFIKILVYCFNWNSIMLVINPKNGKTDFERKFEKKVKKLIDGQFSVSCHKNMNFSKSNKEKIKTIFKQDDFIIKKIYTFLEENPNSARIHIFNALRNMFENLSIICVILIIYNIYKTV